jgi:hypothetical protein
MMATLILFVAFAESSTRPHEALFEMRSLTVSAVIARLPLKTKSATATLLHAKLPSLNTCGMSGEEPTEKDGTLGNDGKQLTLGTYSVCQNVIAFIHPHEKCRIAETLHFNEMLEMLEMLDMI